MLQKTALMAILLALGFEATVYGWTPGAGHLLFWLLAVAATATCNRAAERSPLPAAWMFIPSLLFALSVTLYDAAAVRLWSTALGMLSLLWAVSWNLLKDRGRGALARLFPSSTFHPARLAEAGGDTWRPLLGRASDCGKPCASVLRGLLLAVPLLLVFGALLCSADMVFARALESLQSHLGHLSLTFPLRLALWLGLFSAWLKLWLTAPREEAPRPRTPFGTVELTVALGAVNLLLLAFLAIQVRYLFGGAGLVEALGLDYAEYARKGFFQLSICIGLILPLVMTGYTAAQQNDDPSLRWLGGALILQAGGLAVSAFRRMLLYIATFGLSVERFYAAAGILVALAVLAWAAYACLRPRDVCWVMARQTVTVLFLLGALSLLDVEGRICRYNLARELQPSPASGLALADDSPGQASMALDIDYFGTLSCDAVPAISQALPRLSPQQQKACLAVLQHLRRNAGSTSGPSWNLSRSRTLAALPAAEPKTPPALSR
jgi:hypothetical protein